MHTIRAKTKTAPLKRSGVSLLCAAGIVMVSNTARAVTIFSDDLTGSTLNPAWQVLRSGYHRFLVSGSVLLIAAFGAAVGRAAAVTYDINFAPCTSVAESCGPVSGSGIVLPTSGSFTYDSITETFSSFSVTWNGFVFNTLALSASSPLDFFSGPSCIGGKTGAAASFAVLSGACFPPSGNGDTAWVADRIPTDSPTFEFLTDDPEEGQGGISALIDINETCCGGTGPALSSGVWTITAVITPEPSGFSLLAIGAVGLLAWGLCKRATGNLPLAPRLQTFTKKPR